MAGDEKLALKLHETALVVFGRFMVNADPKDPSGVDYATMGRLAAEVINGIPAVRAALASDPDWERLAWQQGARREMLEFAIALADDRLNKRGDPIACHIYLVEALAGHKLSDALQDEARDLLEARDGG